MATEIKPTKDAVFKIIFGSNTSDAALKSLIESVLGKRIQEVRILNSFEDVAVITNKKTILDINDFTQFLKEVTI